MLRQNPSRDVCLQVKGSVKPIVALRGKRDRVTEKREYRDEGCHQHLPFRYNSARRYDSAVESRRYQRLERFVCSDGASEMQRSTSSGSGATATIRKQTIHKGDLSQAPKLDDGDGGGFGNFDDGDGGDGGDDDGDWGWEEVPWKGSALGFLVLSALMWHYYKKEKAWRKGMKYQAGIGIYSPVQYDDDMDLSTIISYPQ